MTVEHLIGKSQGGYLKQIRELVDIHFARLPSIDKESLAKEIDTMNTVTACQFCNSTTSRDNSEKSMYQLFEESNGQKELLLSSLQLLFKQVLNKKKATVDWKLASVKEAFEEHVTSKIKSS